MYTSKDNMMLIIRRKKDHDISYLRQAELTYTHELYSGFSYKVILRNRREYTTELAVFDKFQSDRTLVPQDHYDITQLELNFRYARNEKFYQTRNQRIPITFDAAIFNVNHVAAVKHV